MSFKIVSKIRAILLIAFFIAIMTTFVGGAGVLLLIGFDISLVVSVPLLSILAALPVVLGD